MAPVKGENIFVGNGGWVDGWMDGWMATIE
jgi:hypothetical protein